MPSHDPVPTPRALRDAAAAGDWRAVRAQLEASPAALREAEEHERRRWRRRRQRCKCRSLLALACKQGSQDAAAFVLDCWRRGQQQQHHHHHHHHHHHQQQKEEEEEGAQAAAAVVNAHGGAALAAAVRRGHVDLALWLVESWGADPRSCLPHNDAPVLSLVARVAKGRLPESTAVPLLSALCGRTQAGPDLDSPRNAEGHTALSLACLHGLSRLVRVLLLAGAEPYRHKRLAHCNAWTAAMRGPGRLGRHARHQQEQEHEPEAAAAARAAAAGRAACLGMMEEAPRFVLLVKARGVRDAVAAAKTLWEQQQEQEQEQEQQQQQEQQSQQPSPRPNSQSQRRQRRAAAAAAVAAAPGLACLRWRLAGAAGSSGSGGGSGRSVTYPRVEVKAGGGGGSDERLVGVLKNVLGGGLVPDLWGELRAMLDI